MTRTELRYHSRAATSRYPTWFGARGVKWGPVTDTPDSRPSFWTTLPGVLAALAAVITATAALYAALRASDPPASSSPRTNSSFPASSLPARRATDPTQVAPRTPLTTTKLPSEHQPTKGATTTGPSDSLLPYEAADYSADIPAGWSQVEFETRRPLETENRWDAPGANNEYLLIDTHRRTHLTPEQNAQPVHANLERAAGYQEIYYGPGDLSGIASWMWVFDAEGSERIDYFFETCRKTMAVLGSAEPTHFAQSRPTYRAVAQSIRPHCT